ncbi:MAG: DUF302 domain-containing protein [Desulfuromusa sp.]|nr:DUF302 domain-containing protein [Desulfuromusa sp.]
MSYYFNKITNLKFDEAITVVTTELGKEGFGVLSEIDLQGKIKEKLGKDIPPYKILGACNPIYAFAALQSEPHIGTMLPCNVIVREVEDGKVEVSAINPVDSMQAVGNPDLQETAGLIQEKLKKVIAAI